MKIGNIELSGQVILAPMAGVCNSAFRKICKEITRISKKITIHIFKGLFNKREYEFK